MSNPLFKRAWFWAVVSVGGIAVACATVAVAVVLTPTAKVADDERAAALVREMDREYWQVERSRLDRMVMAACGIKANRESSIFDKEAIQRVVTEVEIKDAATVALESEFAIRHKVNIKQYREEFNKRHPLTEALYNEVKPAAIEAVAKVAVDGVPSKSSHEETSSALIAAAKEALRSRPAYKSLAAEFE